ncbi:MAG TPA: bacillithiol biosynthesis deacetylase BshB1 [Thermoanaerobaculia bacterium]|nr:bacillithiol biosynthesis deacetylase BshB1 [Thermoanaerobaculia bacterium]
MAETVDALFFAAHADDIELSAAATLVHIVRSGRRAGIVDLTHGEMGTRGTPEVRLAESKASAKILGAAFRERLDFGDGGLRTGRDEELQLIDAVRRWRPTIVFAPWTDERHPDHSRAGRLVTDASFYAGLRKIESQFPAHRPQVVAYYLQNYLPPLSFVVDVTDTWAVKMEAIHAYKSQFFNPNSKEPRTFIAEERFLEMIEARGKHFGALIGARYGEAFVTKQPPKVQDVFSAYSGREV